jgi:hypothetical protein
MVNDEAHGIWERRPDDAHPLLSASPSVKPKRVVITQPLGAAESVRGRNLTCRDASHADNQAIAAVLDDSTEQVKASVR